MDLAHDLPVCGLGEVHAGTNDVLQAGSGTDESVLNDLKDAAGLLLDGLIVGAHGASARDVHVGADAHSAREADDWLERGTAGDVLSHRRTRGRRLAARLRPNS